MLMKPGLNQWCMAREWRAQVWLNGVDVSDICRGVLINGEVPEAVDLYELDDRGRFFVREDTLIAHRVERGEIRVEGLRLRRVEHDA